MKQGIRDEICLYLRGNSMRCVSGIVDFAVAVGPIGIIIIMSTGMITMSV